MSQDPKTPPEQNSDPLSISRLPPEEEEQFSAPAPQIEGYQILEKLGEAGQGQVWRAVQLSTGRQVALKVPRIGLLSSKKTLARFEREVEITASLRHSNIARIYDSGVHHGLYFYVMDLVEGKHLDQYVKDNALSQRQILELMKVICEAVQHAHQNGVIHRDLKPPNIIVTEEGHPYIVDFGLAKTVLATEAATVSAEGEVAGTPAYMSPEQAAGHTEQVDTRTDVYSLGAILFTLLTGRHPHDLSGSRLDVLRRITEGEVLRPRKLHPRMDRDLESLLLKALEHDPDRRYSSAAGLAEDVDNYLQGLPLSATPRSHIRRMASFVRRHRVGVAFGASIFLLGVIAIVTLAASTIIIGREKQRTQEALEREQRALAQETQARTETERQARISQAITDFLNQDLLASVDPARARGRQLTVREILDAASQRVEGKFEGEPLVEASVRQTLGNTYGQLGEYAEAARQLECSYELYQEHLPAEDPEVLRSMNALSWQYINQGRYEETEPLLLRSLEISERAFGNEDSITLAAMGTLATLYNHKGQYTKAEPLYLKALEIEKRVSGEDHLNTLNQMHNLAMLYSNQGRYQEAESLYCKVLEIKQRRFGTDHPDTLRTMGNLGLLYKDEGRYEQAEVFYLKTLELMERVLGEEHPDTLRSIHNLASLYGVQMRRPEAESLLRRLLEIKGRVLGEEHSDTLSTMNNLMILLCEQARFLEAEPLCVKMLEIHRRVLGEDHPDTLNSWHNLATLYRDQHRYEEAERLYCKTAEARERVLGEDHPDTIKTLNLLVALCETRGKPEEARKWRARLAEGNVEHVPSQNAMYTIPDGNLEIPDELHRCAANLQEVYAAIGKYHQDEGTWPDWLSDLIPRYLNNDALLCPDDPTHKSTYSPDPKLPCSYSWEWSSDRIAGNWDQTGRMSQRDWKTQQTKVFGNLVPMVRCMHHGDKKVLNLSLGGQIYLSPLDWEYMLKKDYHFGDERQSQSPGQAGAAVPPVGLGKPAPAFTLQNLDGQQVSLLDFKGKVVLLDFWATWCPPCVKTVPHLEAFYQKYKEKGLVIIGLNDERYHAKVKEFANGRMSYPILVDAAKQFGEYSIRSIPTLLYIDREGVVRHMESGFSEGKEREIEARINELLGLRSPIASQERSLQ